MIHGRRNAEEAATPHNAGRLHVRRHKAFPTHSLRGRPRPRLAARSLGIARLGHLPRDAPACAGRPQLRRFLTSEKVGEGLDTKSPGPCRNLEYLQTWKARQHS